MKKQIETRINETNGRRESYLEGKIPLSLNGKCLISARRASMKELMRSRGLM